MYRRALLAAMAGGVTAAAGCVGRDGAGPAADAPRRERVAVLRSYRTGTTNAEAATEALRRGVEATRAERFEVADASLGRAERRGFVGEERFVAALADARALGDERVAQWAVDGRTGAGLLEASAGTGRQRIRALEEGDTERARRANRVSRRAASRGVAALGRAAPPERVRERLGL